MFIGAASKSNAHWSIFIAFSIIFIHLASDLYANEKAFLWFGLGSAEGRYQENYFGIDDEIRGDTYEYNEYRYETYKNRGLVPSSKGSTKSFFVHYTLFDPSFEDSRERTHKLSFTEVIPHWSRGYQYTVHLSKKWDMFTSADLFFGLGLVTFEKDIENVKKYDYKIGYDLSYGYSMNWLFKYDDNFFFGWRSLVKNNRITLDYGSDTNFGYLTHRRDILFVLGYTFVGKNPLCVDTQYVKCD